MEIRKKYLLPASREKVMVSSAGYSLSISTGMYFSSRICHSDTEAFLVLVNCKETFWDRRDKGILQMKKTRRLLFMGTDKIQS